MTRLGYIISAGSLAAAFCLPSPASAATRVVNNCNDSGAGSLRNAIASALSGDIIDLSKLSCTRITLTSGQLEIPQASLTLLGRSRYLLTIDGNKSSRVLHHSGAGTLQVKDLTLANGRFLARALAEGGCIRSEGNVDLDCVRVHHCVAEAIPDPTGQTTSGGGVSARGNILLSYSSVYDNVAAPSGFGGGLRTRLGHVKLHRSQVYGNVGNQGGGISTHTLTANYSILDGNEGTYGGGAYARGRVVLNKSTISNNRANAAATFGAQTGGGGLFTVVPSYIVDSTISGNSAVEHGGVRAGIVFVYNSTIAFNHDDAVNPETGQCGAALFAFGMRLESSIIARNTCGNGPDWDITANARIEGFDNLVEHSRSPIPADTINLNPRLGPLAENGGPTRTHMLLSDSPAINSGSNVQNRLYDQRGPGFPRTRGPGTDIGAIER